MFAGFCLKALKTTSKTFGKAARLSSLVKISLLTRAFSGLLNKFNDRALVDKKCLATARLTIIGVNNQVKCSTVQIYYLKIKT